MKEFLVSCLCITANRPLLLQRAVECFFSQTYHLKELVIVYKDTDIGTDNYLRTLTMPEIVKVKLSGKIKYSLGELRNISIESSNGTYICQWDDDDWYHSQRLEVQMNTYGKDSSVLMNVLIYNKLRENVYFSTFRPWENTILCKRSLALKLGYLPIDKSEDSDFVNRLLQLNKVYPIIHPPLYIYVYHGNNTWHEEHFNIICALSQKLSSSNASEVKKIITGDILNNDVASKTLISEQLIKKINYLYRKPKKQT